MIWHHRKIVFSKMRDDLQQADDAPQTRRQNRLSLENWPLGARLMFEAVYLHRELRVMQRVEIGKSTRASGGESLDVRRGQAFILGGAAASPARRNTVSISH